MRSTTISNNLFIFAFIRYSFALPGESLVSHDSQYTSISYYARRVRPVADAEQVYELHPL